MSGTGRGKPQFNDEQKEALRRALNKRLEDPVPPELQDPNDQGGGENGSNDQAEEIPEPLDLAENFVNVLATLPDVNNNQRQIAYYLARGHAPPVVASKVGVTAAYVRSLRKDSRIAELIKAFKGGAIYDIVEEISAQEVLDRASYRAAEVLAEKMNAALDESTQVRAALAILDRTGHGTKSDAPPIQVTIDREAVSVYREARAEAGIEDADYQIESEEHKAISPPRDDQE